MSYAKLGMAAAAGVAAAYGMRSANRLTKAESRQENRPEGAPSLHEFASLSRKDSTRAFLSAAQYMHNAYGRWPTNDEVEGHLSPADLKELYQFWATGSSARGRRAEDAPPHLPVGTAVRHVFARDPALTLTKPRRVRVGDTYEWWVDIERFPPWSSPARGQGGVTQKNVNVRYLELMTRQERIDKGLGRAARGRRAKRQPWDTDTPPQPFHLVPYPPMPKASVAYYEKIDALSLEEWVVIEDWESGKLTTTQRDKKLKNIKDRWHKITGVAPGRKVWPSRAFRNRWPGSSARGRRAEREGRDYPEVGDILYSSWGYNQTNIDFYQITKVTPKQVVIEQLQSKITGGGRGQDKVMPLPGRPDPRGKKLRRKWSEYNGGVSVSINSYSSAYSWDGKPQWQTAAGYGH